MMGRGEAPAGHLDLPGGGLWSARVAYGPEREARAFECLSAGMGAPARTGVLFGDAISGAVDRADLLGA